MKILSIIIAILLILHGLIHLMGVVTYLKLGTVQGLTYKTALLNGRWDWGENGIRLYGALWGLAALGFVVAAIAMLTGAAWWRPLLGGVTFLSLALTALDWKDAFAGAILNLVILAWLGVAAYIAK
ncbi:MAG: hypothetical protein Kow0070_19840 [Anaerolineales bacterium]